MGIMQQFFNNLRLVIMQSLSCFIPFCKCKNARQMNTSEGTQKTGNKDARQFEHIVGSIYSNFDPQTGIPLHQDVINDRRHGKYTSKKPKSVAKSPRRHVSKDNVNKMPDQSDRDGKMRLFTNVSILNMVLGEKANTGSSVSMCRKTGDEFSSHTKELSSADANKEYSSSYNDGDKYQYPTKSRNTDRQDANVSPTKKITFEESVNPSTSDDNNEYLPRPNMDMLRDCASSTKSNLRKLKLQIANNLEGSCSCVTHSDLPCPTSNAIEERFQTQESSLEKIQTDDNMHPTTFKNKLYQPSQNKETKSAFDNYVSPTSSRLRHKTRQNSNNEANCACDHCFSPTTLKLKKETHPANCIDTKIRCTAIKSEDDKGYPLNSKSKESSQRDRNASPTALKLEKNVPPNRPRGLKITIDKNFSSRTSLEVSSKSSSNNDVKDESDQNSSPPTSKTNNPHITLSNTEENNMPCGNYSNSTSEVDKDFPQNPANKEAKNKSCHFSPSISKVKKKTSPCPLPKEVKITCNLHSSNTSDEDKLPKTASNPAKYEYDRKFSPTEFKGKRLVCTSSNSQDDDPCECTMGGCDIGCNKKVNSNSSCHDKTDTDTGQTNEVLESGSDKPEDKCSCKKNGIGNCKTNRKNTVCVNRVYHHAGSSTSPDYTSEDFDSDVKNSCKCACHSTTRQLNIVYEHSLEDNLFPGKDHGYINSILALQPLSSATESSNEERKSTSDLTMDEEHVSASDNVCMTYNCSCKKRDSVRNLSSPRSSDSYIVTNHNVYVTEGRKIKIDEEGHNTSIPRCVINHLKDHNVTFHIVKVCED